MAGKKPLSEALLKQQMIMMGKLTFRPSDDIVRKSIFEVGTFKLRPLPSPAKRGRPRIRWPVHILSMCVRIAGSYERLLEYWHLDNSSFSAWENHVRNAALS